MSVLLLLVGSPLLPVIGSNEPIGFEGCCETTPFERLEGVVDGKVIPVELEFHDLGVFAAIRTTGTNKSEHYSDNLKSDATDSGSGSLPRKLIDRDGLNRWQLLLQHDTHWQGADVKRRDHTGAGPQLPDRSGICILHERGPFQHCFCAPA